MDPTKAPPQIFDRDLLRLRRERAARRNPSFLALRCAEDAAERLCDINRQFSNALIIGSQEFCDATIDYLPDTKRPHKIATRSNSSDFLELNASPPKEPHEESKTYDLIISALDLHSVNDLPGALIGAKRQLKPDGIFIGAMFGGETLGELRQAAYAADDRVFGGLTPRVSPFADYSQAAALLQRSGFALPVVDSDRMTVRYQKLEKLFSDLRDMGETNCLLTRNRQILGKTWRRELVSTYKAQSYEQERFIATFEILWMTGWAPHESQQKPLKPGSAKMRLADALGAVEKPAI